MTNVFPVEPDGVREMRMDRAELNSKHESEAAKMAHRHAEETARCDMEEKLAEALAPFCQGMHDRMIVTVRIEMAAKDGPHSGSNQFYLTHNGVNQRLSGQKANGDREDDRA